MTFPAIGEVITPLRGAALCRWFGLYLLANKVEMFPDNFQPFRFDGVSGMSEPTAYALGGVAGEPAKEFAVTYFCALQHDLEYAYGEPRDSVARAAADSNFYRNLVTKARMAKPRAFAAYAAVRLLGAERIVLNTGFLWAFARR